MNDMYCILDKRIFIHRIFKGRLEIFRFTKFKEINKSRRIDITCAFNAFNFHYDKMSYSHSVGWHKIEMRTLNITLVFLIH